MDNSHITFANLFERIQELYKVLTINYESLHISLFDAS